MRATNRLAPPAEVDFPSIRATLYEWRDPASIPLRPWIYGRWFLRGTVACIVAPGGVGKSTLVAGTALAMSTGRGLLGKAVWEGPKRVWLWNLEDDLDELSRSIQAATIHHDIAPTDIEGRLFVDSAMEGAGLCTAIEVDGEFRLLAPVYQNVAEEIRDRMIDVLVIDPFVSSHEIGENDNAKIDKVSKAWARVAKEANCCVILVHHTSKAGSSEVTAMSARGAVALINAARSTLVINRMENEEAERLGIPTDERRRYISVQDDKHNRAPAEKADWYRLASVDLGNGPQNSFGGGDSVAVVESWSPPDPFDNVTPAHIASVQGKVADGEWRENVQATKWVGHALADVLGLDAGAKADKARIKSILKEWIANGVLKTEIRTDKNYEEKKFVVVGRVVQP